MEEKEMKKEKTLRFFTVLLVVTMGVFGACSKSNSSSAGTISYPTKPIQLISPSSAGGDLDYDNRLFAQFMTRELGVNMVVSNISGAGTVTGMKQVLGADHDGYTIVGNNPEGFFPKLIGNTDVGVESFKLAGVYATDSTTILVAHSDLPGVKDLPGFVKYAKDNPGKVQYGLATGSTNHMLGFAFDKNLGIEARFVDVGNNSEKLTALLGRQIDFCTLTYQLTRDYIASGDFIVLALLDSKHNPYFPEIPIFSDFGYIDVEYVKIMWIGMPPETPDNIVNTFSAAMERVVNNPGFRAECEKVSLNPVYYGPQNAYSAIDAIRASSFAPFAEQMVAALQKK
jgi:tripartite-type tricarboxylate transporter receptor subunit TctC